MEQHTTLEQPADVARYLITILGKNRVKDIRYGYRLDENETTVKFKITLKFPYNLFSRKSLEEKIDTEIAKAHLSSELPAKLFFQIQ
jgi:hypothetical protein